MELQGLAIVVAESSATFRIKKLGFMTVNGDLPNIDGKIHFDPTDVSNSSFDIRVPTSGINTNNEKRDEHLKTQDFFAVEQYPEITFKSTSVEEESGQFSTTGNLQLLGKTKEINIPFSFNDGVFEGNFSLNRLDYALGTKFPSFFVGKTVQINIYCKIK
ncbi:MAG: YceI family protein [Bacteroidota bacterium]